MAQSKSKGGAKAKGVRSEAEEAMQGSLLPICSLQAYNAKGRYRMGNTTKITKIICRASGGWAAHGEQSRLRISNY